MLPWQSLAYSDKYMTQTQARLLELESALRTLAWKELLSFPGIAKLL